MSSAVRNSSTPPAMRKAGIEMPRKFSTASPATPNSVRMPSATRQARTATLRRSPMPMPCVSATKSGARPTGSMITKSATKAGM
jgi:hypothetical protein